MDELLTIIEERKESIAKMKEQQQGKHKSMLVEEDRKRNQRQNWILRVLKTLKVLSNEQKKIIFESTVKIMNYYQPMEAKCEDFQKTSYTETIINLFVEFYNKFQGMDLTYIKTIIRPNNVNNVLKQNYIVVDLIKSLIELGRKEFRLALQEQFKESVVLRVDVKYRDKFMSRSQNNLSKLQMATKNNQQGGKTVKKGVADAGRKINTVLYEKYNKYIDNYNHEVIHEKFNDLYFELLYLNNKNSSKIQKYMDSCYGSKRHIIYDASGLYTQKQLKRIADQREEKSRNRAAELKQLMVGCPIQHLKQYFKMKVEFHLSTRDYPSFGKTPQIREWLPITMLKNGNKLHPYTQTVQFNGIRYSIQQFQEKANKKFKVHVKELIKEHFSQLQICKTEDMALFNKKEYLDFNNCKINELLKEQTSPYHAKRQKQGLLPPISSTNTTQSSSRSISKVKSDVKLPTTNLSPCLKKGSDKIYSLLQRRMNHSSLAKDANPPSKRKMDNIIDSIILARQYTVN